MSSILDKVITSQYKEKLSKFNPHEILDSILDILSEREQEIVKMRHGLSCLVTMAPSPLKRNRSIIPMARMDLGLRAVVFIAWLVPVR